MKELIEQLFKWNRGLLGEGYDNSLEYLKTLIGLDIIEIPSGTKFGTWTVPDEWVVRDAWVKFKGEKILDYQVQPLSLVVGSLPIHKTMNLEELRSHLHFSEERPDATPYAYKFYDKDWGFCLPWNSMFERVAELEENSGVTVEGEAFTFKNKCKLEEGEYEVFIDTEYRPGKMKLGVHTIKGTSDREVLLFAHVDHPFQANDNLSGVACLTDLATKIKTDHTIKIIFCPETVGSIAYALTQDISKVDFVIAVDVCGNKNSILMQKSFDRNARINFVSHLALHSFAEDHRKGEFRNSIGSDEYFFNDPKIGIPGILLSTWPYPEYHTSDDTPEIIDYERVEKTGKLIMKIIEIYEKDFIPVRNFIGPLMRSKYGIQSSSKQVNLSWDYLIYSIDGERSLVQLCCDYGLNFDFVYQIMQQMIENGDISRSNLGEGKEYSSKKQKHTRLQRGTNVSRKHKKVS